MNRSPFCGRKGRTRLAVVDGVVNESVIRLVVSALPERERVVVCGTGIDTDARPILRELVQDPRFAKFRQPSSMSTALHDSFVWDSRNQRSSRVPQ